jgi:hypothetical protein
MALTTNGKKKNHAAIVVAVTFDKQFVWIAEGNHHDELSLRRLNYFYEGKLNPDIDGIGRLDSGLFGYINTMVKH